MMDRYLNIAASVFAFLFCFTIFLIMSGSPLDVQIFSLLMTILSIFVAIVIFIASVVADSRQRAKALKEVEEYSSN